MSRTAVLLGSSFIVLLLCSTAQPADSARDQVSQLPGPEYKVIDKWRGTWDVKATRRQPLPAQESTYVETFDWVLDGRYLRSETSRKSDGGMTMSMFWFDVVTKNYRLALFDSSGMALELPAPTWNDVAQSMEWKSSLFTPTSYAGSATFTDLDTIHWKSLWKDWKGTVILDLEGTSVRRK
jgi:hypothetical protein